MSPDRPSSGKSKSLLGERGEAVACDRLRGLGYTILARNYRSRLGEIDIIAEESGMLVFIEVKTRSGWQHGHPAEALTPRKQRQISKVALGYLSRNGAMNRPARFDVVSIVVSPGNESVEVLRNAFDLCYDG